MPCGQKAKTENRNNIVTNSIKTLKIVHIKKKKKNLKKIIKGDPRTGQAGSGGVKRGG